MAMGFLPQGTFQSASAIMDRFLEELKNETGTRQLLESLQRRTEVAFTSGGLLVMTIPIVEAAGFEEQRLASRSNLTLDTVSRSLETIMKTSRGDPSPTDRNLVSASQNVPVRTSLSVFRAAHKAWCNIPPICGET